MKNALMLTALLAIVVLCSLPVFGSSIEPLTVSPGATDRLTGVEVRCPTFSWQAVPEAVGYEVVVYELPPDLVLDGVEDGETDALISQSGIRRSSAGIETFSFENTGGGDMHLGVIGTIHGNGSGLVDVDAETLNGHDSSAFSPVVHLHDDRYYTETELNTSGAGGSVNWNNLAAVPPGFADGVDDEATFNAGPGIIIDNGQVRVDSTAFTTQLSTIDGPGDIVLTTSIAIGTDGLGLISFYEFTGQDLKVAQCNDAVCSGAATATLDSGGVVGFSTSIAIGADGLGLISYRDATNEDLKAAHLGIGVP